MSRFRSWELYYKAVRSLATHQGSLQDRLGRAMQQLVTLGKSEIPDDLLERHETLMNDMQQMVSALDGSLVATARSLDDTQAYTKAEEIIDIYTSITRAMAK